MSLAAGQIATETDIQAILNASSEKPVVKLIQTVAQTMTDNAADAALTFTTGSTDIDTHSFHSESSNTSRITPSIAGIYRFRGTMVLAAITTAVTIGAVIAKNGTAQAPRARIGPNSTASQRTVSVETILSMNGTTDYAEILGFQDSAGNVATTVGSSFTSTFECEYLRGPA